MALFNKTLRIKDLLDIDRGRVDRSQVLKVQLINIYNIVKEENWLGKILRFFKIKRPLIFYKVFKYKVSSANGGTYTVLIKVSPGFDKRKFYDNKVQVFCQCADFKYRVAYELNKHDNVYLNKATINELGIALTTKPTRVQTSPLCKHLYAAILEFGKNLDKYDLY